MLMKKSEIASHLSVNIYTINWWADKFTDWLDSDPRWKEKDHDEGDVQIFTIISDIDKQINENIAPIERLRLIEQGLWSSKLALDIKYRLDREKSLPETIRWEVISTLGVSLKREYDWLKPLQPYVDRIVTIGCWATEGGNCAEPYALLWTLQAKICAIIDKEPKNINNAQEWLGIVRNQYSYFKDYNLEFVIGDITSDKPIELDENEFDLCFCQNVLYYLQDEPDDIVKAIMGMKNLVKAGGWIIAIEPKIGVKFKNMPVKIANGVTLSRPFTGNEPVDISKLFEEAGLKSFNLEDVPEHTYCYKKQIG